MVKKFHDPDSCFFPKRRLVLPCPKEKHLGRNNMNLDDGNDLSLPIACGLLRDKGREYDSDNNNQYGYSQFAQ